MAGYLLSRAKYTGLASDVITNELISTTRLSIDHNLLPAKLGYQSDSCEDAKKTNRVRYRVPIASQVAVSRLE